MSYQVLARKYRPQTFDEVVGQDHVMRTLRNAIETQRIPHAFLFVGPRGIGKTSTARILAKALNVPGGPSADFDPDDEVCREIAEGRCMDVLEIDGASNNGVEQVRDLRDNVQYAPTRGKFKLYVIDEVHMLSTAAFNALLKTLEEPPAHVKFIFATTEVHKLPATILSRCQRFDLKRISDDAISKHLGYICEKEGVTVDGVALKLLARNAEGGLRDAESALEQLISFCGKEIREQDVLDVFGLTGVSEVWALAEGVQEGNTKESLEQVRRLVKQGKDTERLAKELLHYFRNLLVYVISRETAEAQMDEQELHHFSNMQPLPSEEMVLVLIEELIKLEEKLRFALVKEVVFEIGILRMAQQREKVSLETVIQALMNGQEDPEVSSEGAGSSPMGSRSSKVPRKEPAGVASVQEVEQREVPREIPKESKQAEVRKVSTENSGAGQKAPDEVWRLGVEYLKKKDASFRRFLDRCSYVGCTGGVMEVKMVCAREMYDGFLKSPKFEALTSLMKRGLGEGVDFNLSFEALAEEEDRSVAPEVQAVQVKEREPSVSIKEEVREAEGEKDVEVSAGPTVALTQADFEGDELILAALKEFDARIVEIKK